MDLLRWEATENFITYFARIYARKECTGNTEKESSYMPTYCKKAKINDLLVQDKIITKEIEQNIQSCICTASSRITKNLSGHKMQEREIEPINKFSKASSEFLQQKIHHVEIRPQRNKKSRHEALRININYDKHCKAFPIKADSMRFA